MSFKQFIKELNGKRVEGELVRTITYSLLTSFIFLALLYFFKFKYMDNFIPKYGIPLFFSALSYALIAATIRQVRAYQNFACMSGMMIGMTSGMIGFLPAFYVGSTNGMFVGGFFGVIVGMFLGVWNGKCCGIMGTLEGMMAGFMGGLMGAMTAVMLLNDHLKISSVLVFIISATILFGLNYMIYLETKETERQREEDYFNIVSTTLILVALTTFLIVFGWRGGVFS